VFEEFGGKGGVTGVADELGEWRRSAFRTALIAREDVEA